MLANGDQKTHFGPHGDQRGSSGWAPTPPQQPCPIPFSLSPCEPRLFWQNQLAELIFKKKKPRQNWSRDHFEATQKANFSILKPNFWSGDTAMGMAHWHNPKRVNFFSNILQNHYFVRWNSYFYQHFSGWLFFANFQTRISYFFTMGLSPCTAWVGDRYIGEVISPFRTLPWQKMTAQFQFFQSLPHKKADFVKKKAGRTWGTQCLGSVVPLAMFHSLFLRKTSTTVPLHACSRNSSFRVCNISIYFANHILEPFKAAPMSVAHRL